jgi:hypothetical protein
VFNDEEAKMGTRALARKMFLEALKRTNLETTMAEKVGANSGVLLVCDRSFDLRVYKCHAALKSRNFTPLLSIFARYLTADLLHLNTGMMH